ncbi:MAG: hypothetical protein J2P19_02090 [Pseudonocardia sp.]|nr:hypothetical protein [Pseudonocardia sp.]
MRYVPRFGVCAAVVAVSAMVVVAGCGHAAPAPTAPSPPPPMPKYASLTELGTAVSNQMRLDKTAKLTLNVAASGKPVTDGEVMLLVGSTGSAVRSDQRVYTGSAVSEISIIVLPDQVYFKAPTLLPLPPGKSWARLRPDTSNSMLQPIVMAAQETQQNVDPTQRLMQMSGAATIVESAEESLDGARTMRYRARIDLNKAATQVTNPQMKQNVQRLLALAQATGSSTMDYVLWLDERNRLQRFLVDQPLPGGQGTVKTEARYHDWGQPVDIQPPPADQIADI